MKKLILLLSVVFALGLFLKPAAAQAQDPSDKEYQINMIMADLPGWMNLMDYTMVRKFVTKSGKVQYKLSGIWQSWYGWYPYEFVINLNATGENGETEGKVCVANGTIYNFWGEPILCGHSQQFGSEVGLLLEIDVMWMHMMFIDIDWAPCMIY